MDIVNAKQELADTQEALADDTSYLAELKKSCAEQTKLFDVVKKTRAEEVAQRGYFETAGTTLAGRSTCPSRTTGGRARATSSARRGMGGALAPTVTVRTHTGRSTGGACAG